MTRQPDAPRHVVANPSDADAILRDLVRTGWTVRDGFHLPNPADLPASGRLVLYGRVSDADCLHQAVLAATRGAGIVAICDPRSAVGRALVDDLCRLGPLNSPLPPAASVSPAPPADASPVPPLARGNPEQPLASVNPEPPLARPARPDLVPEQRALLERLAAGDTIAAAAAAEFLSLRTANRRIAEVRALYGVRTTREAVLAYRRQRGPS